MSAMFFRSHDRNPPHDVPARLVTMEQETCEAPARIVRGARHQDEMAGLTCASDEPFVAANDPAIAFALGARADHARIGAAARRRLRHCKGGAHASLDDRPQPFFL